MDEIIKEIKARFRGLMDGATSQSMREKGLGYHLNWGIPVPRLKEMAGEITEADSTFSQLLSGRHSLYDLAIALWKEDVRECKILATMLMPPDEVLPEVIDIWMDQTPTLEIAEQAAFNLYQHLPYAADTAYRWLASPSDMSQICGYHILSRLFMRGQEPNERGINEFIDQCLCAVSSPNVSLRKAAMNALSHFSDLGLMYERIAASAMRTVATSAPAPSAS